MSNNELPNRDSIRAAIVSYVLENHLSDHSADTLPQDESLLRLGILDSAGVIELIFFLETQWSITIDDSETTHEKMGSVNKMITLVLEKLGKKSG